MGGGWAGSDCTLYYLYIATALNVHKINSIYIRNIIHMYIEI